MHGLSTRNLSYMKAFAEAWPDQAILQQLVAKLPWGHNVRLIDLVKSLEERFWYAQQAIQNGWSCNTLVIHIESGLYRRQGRAITNFHKTLPPPQSDLAQQLGGRRSAPSPGRQSERRPDFVQRKEPGRRGVLGPRSGEAPSHLGIPAPRRAAGAAQGHAANHRGTLGGIAAQRVRHFTTNRV